MTVKSTSLKESIEQTIAGKILSGELKAGELLPPERELSEELGISRSSLHQAIVQLEVQGFVRIIPRKGTVVSDFRTQPTPQSLAALMSYDSLEIEESLFNDMMETRLWLESECARRACSNIYESTLAELEDIAGRIGPGTDDLGKLIYSFHYKLTQASGNSLYSMIFRGFEPVISRMISQHYQVNADDIEESARMHKELVELIKSNRPDDAAECVCRIITQGITVLEKKYDKGA